MFIYTIRRRAVRNLLLLMVTGVFAALLLIYPQAAATGVKRGLSICSSVIIPSLFPFLVLAGFTVRSGLSQSVGRRMGRITRFLFGLPGCCAAGILIGFIGGYPAGGAAVAELTREGCITPSQGKRMLRFCVNGGPAFLLSAVGVGMLGQPAYGAALLAAHWAAALLIGTVGRFAGRTEEKAEKLMAAPPASLPCALVGSVGNAGSCLLGMCGFVLAAATLLSLLDAAGLPPVLRTTLSCITEVSCGALEVSKLGEMTPFLLGMTLGWGGLSVHGQLAAALSPLGLMDSGFFVSRLIHGLLGGAFSLVLFRFIPITVPAFATASGARAELFATSSLAGGAALLLLCLMHLLSVKIKLDE